MEVKQCPICGKQFENRRWYSKGWGPVRQTCSRACGAKLRMVDLATRFWSHVDRSGGPGACWPWMGSEDSGGYGHIGIGRKTKKAHRVAFFLANGKWPENDACHTCDNRACCNPAHIFDGTHAENMADMKAKGRRKGINSGERNGRAQLTEADAREIKRLLATGMSQWEIANQFGVGQTQISKIELGKAWRDV